MRKFINLITEANVQVLSVSEADVLLESAGGNFTIEPSFTQKSFGVNSSPPYAMVVRMHVHGQAFDVETKQFDSPDAAAKAARGFYDAWEAWLRQ
jgi:hypothetical protein